MNDLLTLAIEGHGGLRRWKQFTRFRVAASITGASWALRGQPGVHCPSAGSEFGGIMVPARRRVYVRRAGGSPVLDPVSTSPMSGLPSTDGSPTSSSVI